MSTVGSGTPYNVHAGNGVSTTFAYGFTLPATTDLVVTVDDVPTSAFTVTDLGNAAGGTVVFSAAPANGAVIIFRRVLTLVRVVEYQDNGDLLAETINDDLNRLLMMLQGVNSGDLRSLRAPFPETVDDLPDAESRALTLFAWDSLGQPSTALPASGTATDLGINLLNAADIAKGTAMIGSLLNYVGAVGRLLSLKLQDWVSVKDFGAVGDGVANDTTPIANAIAAALHVWFPPGTYITDQFTLTGYGRSLLGAGNEGTGATGATGQGATIKARGVQTDLLRISGQNHRIVGLTLNGNFTTDVVLRFIPTTFNVLLESVTIERAVNATGRLTYFDSTFAGPSSQIDKVLALNCVLKQDAANNANKALYCVETVGSNAFENTFQNCFFASAASAIKITDGSGLKFVDCQAETFTTSAFALTGSGGFQQIKLDGFYTETGGGAVFWTQAANSTSSPASTPTIEMARLSLNNTNLDITLDPSQPIVIRNSRVSGNISVSALAAGPTLFKPVIDNVQFPAGKGVTGANAGAVIQRNVLVNNVAQADLHPGAPAYVNTTAVGNVGGGNDVLMSYSAPANMMNGAGRGFRFRAWGTTANNANAKTVRATIAGGVHAITTAMTAGMAGKWVIEGAFISTGVDTQDFHAHLTQAGTTTLQDIGITTTAQDDGAAIDFSILVTGVADNDIVQEGLIVTCL